MKKILLGVFLLIAVGGVIYYLTARESAEDVKQVENVTEEVIELSEDTSDYSVKSDSAAAAADSESEDGVIVSESDAEEQTEEEKQAEAEEKYVEDFDAETDNWMDAEKTTPPTMKQIDAFRAKFKKLPQDRKEECLHRALNLVPDENVMLLVGILMDKTEDKELVELIYNDILNRDEDVKKPILQTIFKDKSHPCWADTAWILDATGELPQ